MAESTSQRARAGRALSSQGGDGGGGAVLLAACLLALVRFWRLGRWSLWIDEAYTWADLRRNLDAGQIFNPLGYRAIGAAVELLGGVPDELALRFLPALCGVLCVPLTYWAFRPCVGARRAAWAALFVSASAWHVYWSQSARFYTFAQATSLLGCGLALRGLWCGTGPRAGVVLAVAGALLAGAAAGFHPTAGTLLPAMVGALWLVIALEPSVRARLRPAALLLLMLLLVAAALGLSRLQEALHQHVVQKPVTGWLAGEAHLINTAGYFFTPVLLAGALVGTWSALRRREAFFLFVAATCALTFAIVMAVAARAQMTAQYTFALLPWVAVLATAPLCAGRADPQRRPLELGLCALLLLPALANCGLYFTLRQGERPRWREAYEYVAARRRGADLVLGMAAPIGEFYLGGAAGDLRRPRVVSPLAEWFPEGPRRWTRHERRIWVVVRPQWIDGFREADRARLREWLRWECRLVERFGVEMEGRELDVMVYLRE